ncbi:MAG: hypothetical protein ACK4F9_02725 [Brevinematia bacterium]
MRASIYSLTFKDKERFLTLFSNRVLTVLCSIISALVLFLAVYFSLVWLGVIEFSFLSFMGHGIAVIFIGILANYLKVLEYKLEMISYKETNIHDIIPNFLYVFLLAVSILYIVGYYLMYVDVKSIKLENLSSLIVIGLIGSIIFSYMLSAAWAWMYVNFLSYVSDIDWISKFDEDAFYRLLPLKFYEAKRYHVPLTLGIIELKNYDEVSKKFGKKKIQKIMLEIMDEINSKLRFVDLVARIDDGRKITIVMNIPSSSANIPILRVLEVIDSFNERYNLGLEYKARMVAFSMDMISEMDLLKSEGEEVVVR